MKKIAIILSALLSVVSTVFAQEGLKVVTPLFLATDVPEEEVSVITDYFISKYAFSVRGKAEVIDRDSFDMLVEEHNFQSNDWASKEGRSQLEMLNASHLVRGKLSKFRSQLVVTIKLIDVKTGVVYATYEDRIADVEELFDKMPEICEKLAEQIGKTSDEKQVQTEKEEFKTADENINSTDEKFVLVRKYEIGDKGPAGGIIFHIEKDNIYEFAPELVGPTNHDGATWYFNDFYHGGGYNDWFVPNNELLKIIVTEYGKSIFSEHSKKRVRSSTGAVEPKGSAGGNYDWFVDIGTGKFISDPDWYRGYIIPVRSFKKKYD